MQFSGFRFWSASFLANARKYPIFLAGSNNLLNPRVDIAFEIFFKLFEPFEPFHVGWQMSLHFGNCAFLLMFYAAIFSFLGECENFRHFVV